VTRADPPEGAGAVAASRGAPAETPAEGVLAFVAPDADWLAGRRPFLGLLAAAAAQRGGRLEMEARHGHLGRYTAPDGRVRPIFGNALGANAEAAAMIAADKDYTARLLAAEGLPTPRGVLVFAPAYVARMRLKNAAVAAALGGAEAALAFAEGAGFPVIVKPNAGSEGRGVRHAASPADLRADLAAALAEDDRVRVETWCPGVDLRVVVLDGAARLAYVRMAPAVTGDGTRSVATLARAHLETLAAAHRGPKLALSDPRVVRCLAAQGLGLTDVPARGRAVRLLDSANLSAGGRFCDLSADLPAGTGALARRAAAAVGLRLAGVDLRLPDPDLGPDGATVLEVNAAPGLDYYASQGPAHRAAACALVRDALA